jgi:hypothetical protein
VAKSPFNEVERWVSQDRQRNPRKRSLHIKLRQSKDPLLGNRLGIVVAFLRATFFASAQFCPAISCFILVGLASCASWFGCSIKAVRLQ